jgi:hypothetical protein
LPKQKKIKKGNMGQRATKSLDIKKPVLQNQKEVYSLAYKAYNKLSKDQKVSMAQDACVEKVR